MIEYKITTHVSGSLIGTGSLEERLNQLGADNWEIIGVMLLRYSHHKHAEDSFNWSSVHQIVAKRIKPSPIKLFFNRLTSLFSRKSG